MWKCTVVDIQKIHGQKKEGFKKFTKDRMIDSLKLDAKLENLPLNRKLVENREKNYKIKNLIITTI